MKQHLKHIFDESACLSRRQLRDYIADSMSKEEFHAIEHHISSCPLCSEAVMGLLSHKEPGMPVVVEGLSSNFLNEHFAHIYPEVHLNSLAPAQSVQRQHRKRTVLQPVGYTSIVVAVLIGAGMLWFLQQSRNKIVTRKAQVKQAAPITTVQQPKQEAQTPPATNTGNIIAPQKDAGYWDTGAVHY